MTTSSTAADAACDTAEGKSLAVTSSARKSWAGHRQAFFVESLHGSTMDSMTGALIGASGGVLFSIWYGWYVTTKTIPEMNNRHAATIQAVVADFRAEVSQQREDRKEELKAYWSELRAEREARAADTREIVQALDQVKARP